jgi:hypothetical protein
LKNKRTFDRHLTRNQVLMELVDRTINFFYYIDGGIAKLDIEFRSLVDTIFNTAGIEYYPELLYNQKRHIDGKFINALLEKIKSVNPDFSFNEQGSTGHSY